MALGNILKKKNTEQEQRVGKKSAEAKNLTPVKKGIVPKEEKKISGFAYRILHSPHITEKAAALAEQNQYVFKVLPGSNKTEIKKAVEGSYKVEVVSVKIIKVPERKRRLGRTQGWRKGYTKAIVRLKEGQKIDILPR